MNNNEANDIATNYHIKGILQKIKEAAEKGAFKLNCRELSDLQICLLESKGYFVNKYNMNRATLDRPGSYDCDICWQRKRETPKY